MKKCVLCCLLFLVCAAPALASTKAGQEKHLQELTEKAYIFGYPLLVMDATMAKMTAPQAEGPSLVNRFDHVSAFPDCTFTDVVSPNNDTLYSIAWLDLKDTPMVLELPEMGDRYYVMQLLDGWTNSFASIGSRTTGNRPGAFLITGPGWRGDVPPEMTQVKAPTNMVWILGRTQTNGEADYAAVHAIQAQYRLKALTGYQAPSASPDRNPATPPERVESLPTQAFFSRLNRLMIDNPPASADRSLLSELAALNIGPGLKFDALTTLPDTLFQAVEKGRETALARLRDPDSGGFGSKAGGWSLMPDNIGAYGTDYAFRASIARFGLGANLREDAVYPSARTDALGNVLNGGSEYAIHFPAGRLPPVKAFWSITLYDQNQHLVQNPINRYAIGDRDPLIFNTDGSLTIYVSHASPGPEKEANWLPAPESDFNLTMRLYWPEEAILNNTWPLPRLEKTK
jgi:hypothetical protein